MTRGAEFIEPRKGWVGKEPSIGFLVAGIVSVVSLVWFIIWLSNDSASDARLRDEEVVLSRFVTLLPRSDAWLGVDVLLSEDAQKDNPTGVDGVVASRVMMGSPAYKAGIRDGDIIIRVDGKKVQRPYQLGNVVSGHKKGDTVSVTVDRYGRQRKFHVTLTSRPMGTLAAAPGQTIVREVWLGLDLQEIDPLMKERLGLPDERGVIVAYVYPSSPAARSGIVQGDVIRRVGETRLRNMEQLESIVAAHRPGDILRLTVWHLDGQKQYRITLAQTPPPETQPQPVLPEAEVEIEAAWLGLDIVPLTRREAEELGLGEDLRGMVVDDVAAGRGVDAGFLAGDVITAVNGRTTATVGEFKDATEGAVGALVDVVRTGRHIYLTVPPPGAVGTSTSKPTVRQVNFQFR